jgi:hypothetical protein
MKNRPLKRKELVSCKTADGNKLVEQVHQFKNVENLRSPHSKKDMENKRQTSIRTSGTICIYLVELRTLRSKYTDCKLCSIG